MDQLTPVGVWVFPLNLHVNPTDRSDSAASMGCQSSLRAGARGHPRPCSRRHSGGKPALPRPSWPRTDKVGTSSHSPCRTLTSGRTGSTRPQGQGQLSASHDEIKRDGGGWERHSPRLRGGQVMASRTAPRPVVDRGGPKCRPLSWRSPRPASWGNRDRRETCLGWRLLRTLPPKTQDTDRPTRERRKAQ